METQIQTDLIEERAAIMEHDGGLKRSDAQENAARAHGFDSWAAYKEPKMTNPSNPAPSRGQS